MNLLQGLQEITHYKEEAQRAKDFAKKRQLREAVRIANHLIDFWSSLPQWEQVIWRLQIDNLPEELNQQCQRWQANFRQAVQIFEQAKSIQCSDQGDPTRTDILVEAINLYQMTNNLLYDLKIKITLKCCQQELHRRQNFKKLLTRAEQHVEQRYFKTACQLYQKAQQIYAIPSVEVSISNCQLQIEQEKQYLKKLQKSLQLAQSGQFNAAFKLLRLALKTFPRSDGNFLLKELVRVLKGKKHFNAGLLAEQQQEWQTAVASYQESKQILPEFFLCSFRLGIVAIKTQNFADAIQALEKSKGHRAAYIRGFAYARKNNFQQAQQEWQSLTAYPQVQAQSKIVTQIERHYKLQIMRRIEHDVNNNNLNSAKATSQKFLATFGANSIVKFNLENHIQASLIANQWKTDDWQKIYTVAEQMWSQKFNIETLHNWFVAAFYYAQADNKKLLDLIIAGSMALANLESDSSLKDIPWQANNSVNLSEFRTTVTELIGSLVDAVREQDMRYYLRLRDAYRVELLALKQIHSAYGVRFHDLYFTPGCYNHYQHFLLEVNYLPDILGTLYTPWGSAVAACLDGDSARAQTIKPNHDPSKSIEIFADHLISYYQGCHYLQSQQWRLAVDPLNRAKSTVQTKPEWQEEIDRFCVTQRQQISEDEEHIEFAQFWYDLLASSVSASYLAEYKTRQIHDQIVEEKISLSQALEQTKALVNIDKHNPVLSALIDELEYVQEREKVERLIKQERIDEAVRYAKRSRHERIRTDLRDFFIKILVEGMQSEHISGDELRLIGKWAYELDPHYPALQTLYSLLEIH